MDPSKAGSRMDNNDYSQFAGGYKGQNQMFLPYSNPAYSDLNYENANANYLNQQMGYANPMNFSEGMGGLAGMQGLGATSLENMIPPNDQNMNYYQEYCRLFIANVVLTTQMKELIAEKNELLNRLSELEKGGSGGGGEKLTREPSHSDFNPDKKVRLRRKAGEIERHYKCPSEACQKNYGSEGSLMQHIKLKHPEITEDPDWRTKLINKIEDAENQESGGKS